MKNITLSRGYRFFLYFIILSVESLSNIFAGILSSASAFVKEDLSLNDKQFGSFGIANGFGRVIGCIVFSYYNTKMSRRLLLFFYIFVHGISVSAFTLTNNIGILLIVRAIIGFGQMAASIYVVNYIDQFGLSKYKNAQMSSISLFQAGGKVFAYLVHILVGQRNWKHGMHVQGVYMTVCALIILLSDEKYFSRTYFPRKQINEEERSETIFEEKVESSKKIAKKDAESSYWRDLLLMSQNKIFLMGLLSRCVLYGLNTCLHYFFADYMRTVLKVSSANYIFVCYTFICLTGPASGLLLNLLFKRYIGGYESRKASFSLVILHTISCVFGIGFTLMPNVNLFVASTLGYFIFNSCSLPLLQGILVNSIEKKLSVVGFSFANLLTQVLTSGPSPYIYGAINDAYKEKYPNLAMFCLMSVTVISLPCLIVLAVNRNRKIDEEEKELKAKDEELIERKGNDDEEIDKKE